MLDTINFTNRDLLNMAMPFASLSRKQWEALLYFIERVKFEEGSDSDIYNALVTLQSNQAKTEVINNYYFYYSQELDKPVPEDSITDISL